MARGAITLAVGVATGIAVVVLLAVSFVAQTTTAAADLPPCGPSERLPCAVERDGTTLVVAVGTDGQRAFVQPGVFDDVLAERVNREPRPCFSGAEAC